MGRLVSAGAIVYSQIDFYQPVSSINRLSGVVVASLSSASFINGSSIGWSLTDGTSVSDSSISAGTIYFNEITGSSGYYLVRFYADRVGYWRISITYPGLQVERILEFDVIAAGSLKPGSSGGLVASFIK